MAYYDELSKNEKEYFKQKYNKVYKENSIVKEEEIKEEKQVNKWSATKIETTYRPTMEEYIKLFVEQPLDQINKEYTPPVSAAKNSHLRMYKNVFLLDE